MPNETNDRRLINGVNDVVKLSPIKYKWAFDYYNAANANHWLPQEVNMQKDIEQWKSNVLTEKERNAIETALGFFTTADSLVANNLVLRIYGKLSAPECRLYLLRQAYEEAIHTHSYQHIVESLGLDEERIFNMYREVASIYNKDNFVGGLVTGIYSDDDARFLEALIDFYVVMEGIFFYASFAAILSFKRRNLLPGVVEQFQYIMRDESMHFNFGVDLINGIISENPHLWTDIVKQGIRAKLITATELEAEYADALVGTGILGFTAESFKQYVQFIADRRLVSLALEPAFNVKNPFPWLSEAMDLEKDKNFFETRITSYQTGGALDWA